MPVLSCEHASNAIPDEFQDRFSSDAAKSALASHRGWDPGALPLAEAIAEKLGAPLLRADVSRLLIELNRSPENPERWSEFSENFSESEKHRLHETHFVPWLGELHRRIDVDIAERGFALHLSLHSFTRSLNGQVRDVDIGILFDPARNRESDIASDWIARLRLAAPDLDIRANEPYRGADDGITTLLRRVYPNERFGGIELEVCQSFFLEDRPWPWSRLVALIVNSVPDV
ncbi:MAG: N-formylglutamate amidohydrolase [Verrucomicrobiae bacterium]|nr:N-formylglutamate amidohydrolase [Verrucomicrobiae bacterium]